MREENQTDWTKVIATRCEFNHDYAGLRLDGVKSLTLTTLDGSFRRVYNKGHKLRDEVKTVGSVQVDKVLSLLEGGNIYNAMQLLSSAVTELRQSNITISEVARQMRRLVDAVWARNLSGARDVMSQSPNCGSDTHYAEPTEAFDRQQKEVES